MQQYDRFKRQHPGCVLLFRIGDFYEMFDDDAVRVSKAIGLTLTQRTAGIPMAGVPHHQLDAYLRKMLAAGFRVAIGEQLIDASQAKGIVPRAVTRVLTPGTIVDESLIDGESVQRLGAIAFTGAGDDSPAAIGVADVGTGEFTLCAASATTIADELARAGVRELLYADPGDGRPPPRVARVLRALELSGTARPAWQFRGAEAREALLEQFRTSTLAGFGLGEDDALASPAGAIVRYLRETQTLSEQDRKGIESLPPGTVLRHATLAHLRPPQPRAEAGVCVIDAVSLRALEVERAMRPGAGAMGEAREAGSLLSIFLGAGGRAAQGSTARTAMGRRLLREWLCRPLADRKAIGVRQDIVAMLVSDRALAGEVGAALATVQDVARLAGRLAMGRLGPRELVALARSLHAGERIGAALAEAKPTRALRDAIMEGVAATHAFVAATLASCVDDPPAHLRDGGLVRDGVDRELDEARAMKRDAGAWLATYQARLIERHSLPSLKVGFNSIFGYYIELPQAQARGAPAELERRQTLKNAERFTTPELKEFEARVTTAESRALDRERALFVGLCEQGMACLGPMQAYAQAVAALDALLAFGDKGAQRGWTRPEIVDQARLEIHGGRHPVLDESLGPRFVPNDATIGVDATLALITGPNMAGKSTYIRQVALLTLLAHTGSFVPADRATIGLVDRIFTRIGADDALHAGQSTFMVEMIETAHILNHASPRSLVILDEIGRGTSTLDGLSLAWAIAEHLCGRDGAPGPRTLFATHYHELTDLPARFPGRCANLHVTVREWTGTDGHQEIVFLHKIEPGRADQSYGVHVARLAGIPATVVARARELLESLSVQHSDGAGGLRERAPADAAPTGQLALFTEYVPHPAVEAIRELKLDRITALEAFDALRRLRAQVDGEANHASGDPRPATPTESNDAKR